MSGTPRRAHVDFWAPYRSYLTAWEGGADVTSPPPDGLSHPISGHPCRNCSWEPPRADDELAGAISRHLELMNAAEAAHAALRKMMLTELLSLTKRAQDQNRHDLVAAIQRGSQRASEER